MPDLGIILTTYNRMDVARRTAAMLTKNLTNSSGSIEWIVCDDGSPDHWAYVQAIESMVDPNQKFRSFNNLRKGVGAGMNRAISMLTCDYYLMMEDDWSLDSSFDIGPHIQMMEENPKVAMVRYGYISPGLQATVDHYSGSLYWRVDANGFTYRFTGHPSLRHKTRFYSAYGKYVEGIPPGATELAMCGAVNAYAGVAGEILMPVYPMQQWGLFSHIGSESLADVEPNK